MISTAHVNSQPFVRDFNLWSNVVLVPSLRILPGLIYTKSSF